MACCYVSQMIPPAISYVTHVVFHFVSHFEEWDSLQNQCTSRFQLLPHFEECSPLATVLTVVSRLFEWRLKGLFIVDYCIFLTCVET